MIFAYYQFYFYNYHRDKSKIILLITSSHILAFEKHTQYIFKHLLLRQLQPVYLDYDFVLSLKGGVSILRDKNLL